MPCSTQLAMYETRHTNIFSTFFFFYEKFENSLFSVSTLFDRVMHNLVIFFPCSCKTLYYPKPSKNDNSLIKI